MGVDRKAVEAAFGVVGVCALLGVSRSGCYKFGFNEGRQALWSGGGNGRGSRSAGSHAVSGGVDGAPRVIAGLRAVSVKTVVGIVRAEGIAGISPRR